MLADEIEDPETVSPEALRRRYEDGLAATVDRVGREAVVEESGVDQGTVETIESGDAAGIDLEDAAAILALDDDAPDSGTILGEVRNRLLLGMSTAVLDVEALAAELDADVDPQELQGKVEGRLPMTLSEYATLRHVIASRR